MTIKWTKFDSGVIEGRHGHIYFYRDLYAGRHHEIFPRAQELITKGEITGNLTDGNEASRNVKTPYIVANVSKLIPQIPATFIARAIGPITSSIKEADLEQNEAITKETEDLIDGTEENEANDNGTVIHAQNELIKQIVENSGLDSEHWTNIVQLQVDGGLVGIPVLDEYGIRIEFKDRTTYFPHEDGKGVDVVMEETLEDGNEYLHVYRERMNRGDLDTSHILFSLTKARRTRPIDDGEAMQLLGLKPNAFRKTYKGRTRPFVQYMANDKTFEQPLGVSVLEGQASKQEEINWTLTRNAIVFERNGKPRIAVTKGVFNALKEAAVKRYGDGGKIDHRDMEVVTFDEKGQAMEIIQMDVDKIGSYENVKNYIKLMLMETQTSEKAVDFYMDGGGGGGQTGIAKYYDLLLTILKSERLQKEYVSFLKHLFKACLWLQAENDPAVQIEEPDITMNSMIPISRRELMDENNASYVAGTQSLEITVERNNPGASKEWVDDEVARVEAVKAGTDTTALNNSAQNMAYYLQNRQAQTTNPLAAANNAAATGDDTTTGGTE